MWACARALLFFMGFWYVEETGQRADPRLAPILIGNHISLVEAMYLVATCQPISFVSRHVRRVASRRVAARRPHDSSPFARPFPGGGAPRLRRRTWTSRWPAA